MKLAPFTCFGSLQGSINSRVVRFVEVDGPALASLILERLDAFTLAARRFQYLSLKHSFLFLELQHE